MKEAAKTITYLKPMYSPHIPQPTMMITSDLPGILGTHGDQLPLTYLPLSSRSSQVITSVDTWMTAKYISYKGRPHPYMQQQLTKAVAHAKSCLWGSINTPGHG